MANTSSDFQTFTDIVKSAGLARSYKYYSVITPPLKLFGNVTNDMLSLFCSGTSFPGVEIETTSIRDRIGEQRTVATTSRAFQTATLTFVMDGQYQLKEYFENWMDMIVDPTTKQFQYYESFIGTIDTYGLSNNGASVYKITLNEAYPTKMEAIEFSANSSSPLIDLKVTFVYKNYSRQGLTPSALSQLNTLNQDMLNTLMNGITNG